MRITNKKMLCYMAFQEMQVMLFLFAVPLAVCGGMSFMMGGFTAQAMIPVLIIFFIGDGGLYSFHKHDLYGSFWFCRKERYLSQIWLNVLRALFISVVFTGIHVCFSKEYLEIAAEDMGVGDIGMIHSMPVWQQFIISFLLFYAVYLVLVIDSTAISGINPIDNMSLQMQVRREKFKKLKCYKLIIFILCLLKFVAAVGGILFILYWDNQYLTADIKEGWIWIGSLVLVNAVLLLIMRVRYQPKYI